MIKKLVGIYEEKIRPRGKKILVGLLIFFVVFTLAGFFALPPILKSVLTKELSKALVREVTIDRVKINPYALSMTIRGLLIKERSGGGTFLSCDEIYANLGTLSAVRMAPVLKEIRVTGPYIKITRNQDLSYNFSDLLEQKGPAPKEKPKPLKFSLNNISIENGSIDFLDGPEKTTHTVRQLKIGIPFLSNIPSYVQRFVQPHFSARINGALYVIQGKSKPFADSRETFVDVIIKDVDIPHYLAYVPMKMRFKVVSAFVDTAATVSFVETKEKEPSLRVAGTVSLKNIAVNDEKDKPFFRLPLLDVSIAPSEPLSRRIHLAKVTVQSPEVEIKRDEKGASNVRTLLPLPEAEEAKPVEGAAKPAPKKAEAEAPLSLDIDQIQLTGGKVSFSDFSLSKPFTTRVDPINLKVDHFSNGKDKKSAYGLSLATEAKEAVKVEGQFSMDPLGSEGTFAVSSVPLKKYGPFYRDMVLFDIEDGRLDVSARYRYAKGQKEPEVDLSGISVSLNGLRLKKTAEKGDFVKVPGLSIKEANLSLTKKELAIGSFSTEKGEIVVKRAANGDVNLLTLTTPSAAPAPVAAAASARVAEKSPRRPKAGGKAVESEKPWVISLKQMLVDKYTVRVEDRTTAEPVALIAQNVKVKGENISTAKNSKGKFGLSLLLNGKGSVSIAGTIGVTPLFAQVRIGLKSIGIAPFQPYFTQKVKMTVTGGAISTSGALSLTTTGKEQMKLAYKGEASVANFSSIDKKSGADLLKLESLSLSDLNVGYAPLSIDIKGVSLTNFYALVLVSPQGKINLQDVLSPEEPEAAGQAAAPALQQAAAGQAAGSAPQQTAAAAPSEEKGPAKKIKIDQVTLQGGRIDFEDKSVKPEFATRLSELGGRVSGLSAEQNTTADVEVRGKLNEYAPLRSRARSTL